VTGDIHVEITDASRQTLCNALKLQPAGFWIGFIIGLTSAAIMMMLRMRFLQRLPSVIILQRASR
ncbi:hypothetical protein ACUOA8_57185, partial [Escherichia sp. SS-MK2]